EVNEADYKDYSSSFFAGLTGRDRIGNLTANTDYNQDGKVSYAEAHAFAKVDGETTDWPISTVEAWLQRQASNADAREILETPIEELGAIARPEQQHVITSLTALTDFATNQSYADNARQTVQPAENTVAQAYLKRLEMELINIGMERTLRERQNSEDIATLEKLINCEAGQWQ
ncbi:MAG: Caspase domain-containing protein, partial [Cyanobacteria bacterium J06554_3]